MKEFPLEGEWWLPENITRTVPGRLQYSDENGAQLELMGVLAPEHAPGIPNLLPRPTIHGKTYGTSKVTLLNCIGTGSHMGSDGLAKEEYHAPLMLFGKHFESEAAALFSDFYCDFTHLNVWADIRTIQNERGDGVETVRIDYKSLPEIKLATTDDFSIQVFPALQFKPDWYSYTAIQSTRLAFSFKKPTTLAEYWPRLRAAQNLLTILIGEPVFPSEIEARAVGDQYASISIERRVASHKTPKEALHFMDVVLPLKKMGERSSELIGNWFKKAELLEPIQNLALGTVYSETQYAENRFLSIVQALESYHRRMKGGNDLPPDEHETRIANILNSAPTDHKSWLKWKLGHSNEPHLEKRLKSLGDQFPKYTELLNQRIPDFMARVSKTRNYLTHFDASKEGSFTSRELYFPSEKLRILFWMCMLTEMGYTNSEAESISISHRYFSQILRHN